MNFIELLNSKYNIRLSKQQKEGVLHKDGPALMLAVPGGGKTTSIVSRTAYLIKEHGIDPANILTLTFSKASAIDMKSRYNKVFEVDEHGEVQFSTIHSFSYMLIRDYCSMSKITFPTVLEGIKEDDIVNKEVIGKIRLLKQIYYQVNNDYINDDKLEELSNAIGYVKNTMLPENQFKKINCNIKNFEHIYKQYEGYKKANNLIDFDDMLTMTLEIFQGNKGLLKKYRDRYKYIQVDEGQDTSKIQHEIIKLLANPKNNLFIVADDDQSIYGFRGACPKELLEFEKTYPGAKVFYMEENYRSTKNIVSIANEFIKCNKDRYSKNINTGKEDGPLIDLLNMDNETKQYEYLLDKLKSRNKTSNIAILYRNNISSIVLADLLDHNKIKFYLRDYKPHFFKHWITRDIISFFELAMDNTNIVAFEQVYYKMNSYISKAMLNYVKSNSLKENKSVFDILKEYPGLKEKQLIRIQNLKITFKNMASIAPLFAIEYIERELNYKSYLERMDKEMGYSFDNLNQILCTLKMIASKEKTMGEFINRLNELQQVMDGAKYNKGKDVVTLSTLHSSKGLEFDAVYMIDMVDGQFPGTNSIEELEKNKNITMMEEERRLCYVGMTRAKNNLHIITMKRRNGEIVRRSRFVTELEGILGTSKEFMGDTFLKEGVVVRHNKFGGGTVHEIDGNMITIDFDDYGAKKFLLDMCIRCDLLKQA